MTDKGDIPPNERDRLRSAVAGELSARDELRAAVAAAKKAGGSIRAIAAEIDRSPTTIHTWLRDTNIP